MRLRPIGHLLLTFWLVCGGLLPSAALAPGAAPGASVTGRVVDMASGAPLGGARLMAGGVSVVADAQGAYTLALAPGLYDVRAAAEGYIGMTAPRVMVTADAATPVDFEMIPVAPTEEQEAVIAARMPHEPQVLPWGAAAADFPLGFGTATITDVPATLRVLMPDGSVVVMAMDEYLRGVLPYEMGPYYPMEALKAQAVAARSYAATTHKHDSEGADVCTTTHCQVWKGPALGGRYYDTTDQAVAATAGVAARYQGNIITAFFFGHCDGRTRNNEEVWYPSPIPYLRSVSCVCGYNWLWGHGVGMCQEGARAMANLGVPFDQILKHYYTGITVSPWVRFGEPTTGQAVRGVVRPALVTSPALTYAAFYLDGVLQVEGSTVPDWYWNTVQSADGLHTLRAVVRDVYGQAETSAQVRVDNTPPTGSVAAPAWTRAATTTLTIESPDARWVQCSDGWLWEGESLPRQANTGAPVADPAASGGTALAGIRGVNVAGAWYGPYTCALPEQRSYDAYLRLKTPDRLSAADLATLDVADNQGRRVYAARPLAARAFARSGVYEEFRLSFAYGSRSPTCATPGVSDGLEFRTWYSGSGDLYLDRIVVFTGPQDAALPIAWPLPAEGQRAITVRLLDAAGNATDRQIVVGRDSTPPQWLAYSEPSITVRDGLSGLVPASASWQTRGALDQAWGSLQPAVISATMGITTPVVMSAVGAIGTHVRFRIEDVAGNVSISEPQPLTPGPLPVLTNTIWLSLVSRDAAR